MSSTQKPQDITELRDQLLDAFVLLKDDPHRVDQVGELANCAGKIIGTAKLQLEYAHLRGEVPVIPFLGATSGIAAK